MPYSGGVALFILFAIFLLFYDSFFNHPVPGVLAGGGIAFIIGLWDDFKQTSPTVRLIGVLFAGITLLISGNVIKGSIWIGVPLSLFYVLGAIDAFNMQDGIDGLAGGLGLISVLEFGMISYKMGEAYFIILTCILCGLIAGFLVYNFSPASIFLGDGGSYFIGYLLAFFAIYYSDLNRISRFMGPIFVVGLPVFDAGYAIMRRLRKGISPFSGDRGHFYDRLMQKGVSVRQTVAICWGIQAVIVGIGVYIY